MVKSVHIYGLNAHGVSAARLARQAGVAVTASDLNNSPDFVARVRAQLDGLPLSFGDHPTAQINDAEYVVVCPGVVQSPEMWRQVRATPNWISVADFAGLINKWPNPLLIITGTYGKTTLCDLWQTYLEQVGRSAVIAGNYESPISDLQLQDPAEFLILELDYQQLVATKTLRADAGVILNIHPGDEVFGSADLYARTKLSVADLLRDTASVFITPEVAGLAAAHGLETGPWRLVEPVPGLDSGLIPSTTAAVMNALQAEFSLPPITADMWQVLASHLPPGRRNLVPLGATLKLVNDGAAKGPDAVARLAARLATMTNAILITRREDIACPGVRLVRLADNSAQALRSAVQAAMALAGSGPAIVAYAPGVADVGAGVRSIPHRIELFEIHARQYSQATASPRPDEESEPYDQ